MPYYKDGTHERVYIAMLNGAVCFTDRSGYLMERFTHGSNIVFFDHYELDVLCDNIKFILNNPAEAEAIIKNAAKSVVHETWSDRLDTIIRHDFDD
jgi:hypothetical protein